MKKTILLAALLMVAGCSAPDTATKALVGAGYKDVEITGWKMFGCSDSDNYTTGFNATGPSGVRVSGVVCSGWLKGATIRME